MGGISGVISYKQPNLKIQGRAGNGRGGLILLFYPPQFTFSSEDRDLNKTLVKRGNGTVYVFSFCSPLPTKPLHNLARIAGKT